MEEKLIGIEVAKIAREKGFGLWSFKPSGCIPLFNVRDNQVEYLLIGQSFPYDHQIILVTQTLLQKWLREKHKINVYNVPNDHDSTRWHCYVNNISIYHSFDYEESLEAGLKIALNKIK